MQYSIKLLTIEEAAKVLRVYRTTVSRMISAGELPCIRVRSRKLIREQDVQAFIDNQTRISGEGWLEY